MHVDGDSLQRGFRFWKILGKLVDFMVRPYFTIGGLRLQLVVLLLLLPLHLLAFNSPFWLVVFS